MVTAGTTASSATKGIAANSSSWEVRALFSTTTTETTVTSGDSFSRATITQSAPSWETTSDSFTVGNESTTINAYSTQSYSTTASIYDAYTFTTTYPVGNANVSTTELVGVSSRYGTSSAYSIVPFVNDSFSFSADGGHGAGGNTFHATYLSYKNYAFIGFGGTPTAITPIAPNGAFVAGSDLRSDGNVYNFGSNLEFDTTRIPFPLSALASVFSNVNTPYPGKASTTGTNSHTFLYSWKDEVLHLTEQSTTLSGTHTVTQSTVTSGTFSTFGDVSSYYTDGGTVFGGFPYIPTASDSVYFPPRAILGTSISPDGSSTTYRTIITHSASTAMNDTVLLEETIPAYYVYTYAGETPFGGASPYLEFARNAAGF